MDYPAHFDVSDSSYDTIYDTMSEYEESDSSSITVPELVGQSIMHYAGKLTPNHCGYCDGDHSVVRGGIGISLKPDDFQGMLDRGWSRSGTFLYLPDMWATCCPQYTIRLKAADFKPSKDQKKCLREINSGKHGEMKMELKRAAFSDEAYELYSRYQLGVHKDKPEDVTEEGFKNFLCDSPVRPVSSNADPRAPPCGYGSFHLQFRLDGKLVAVTVCDVLPKCLVSKYAFYDPGMPGLSLGKYSALNEIDWVRRHLREGSPLEYYYMGFYIESCSKMSYKGRYKPSDLLCPATHQWVPLADVKNRLIEHNKDAVSIGALALAEGERDPPVPRTRGLDANILIRGAEGILSPRDLSLRCDPNVIVGLVTELNDAYEALGEDLASRLVFRV